MYISRIKCGKQVQDLYTVLVLYYTYNRWPTKILTLAVPKSKESRPEALAVAPTAPSVGTSEQPDEAAKQNLMRFKQLSFVFTADGLPGLHEAPYGQQPNPALTRPTSTSVGSPPPSVPTGRPAQPPPFLNSRSITEISPPAAPRPAPSRAPVPPPPPASHPPPPPPYPPTYGRPPVPIPAPKFAAAALSQVIGSFHVSIFINVTNA